jgi:hypothetical protein
MWDRGFVLTSSIRNPKSEIRNPKSTLWLSTLDSQPSTILYSRFYTDVQIPFLATAWGGGVGAASRAALVECCAARCGLESTSAHLGEELILGRPPQVALGQFRRLAVAIGVPDNEGISRRGAGDAEENGSALSVPLRE